MDSVISCVFFNGRFLWFESNSPTYDEVVSSGQLGIIQSDSLKNSMSAYCGRLEGLKNFLFYESREIKAKYNEHKNQYFDASIMTEYWKVRSDWVSADSLSGYHIDWEGFRSDPETSVHLRNSKGVNKELAHLYQNSYMFYLKNLLTALRNELDMK
ncbi:hypothetical protein [Ekhidna sp.]|uniref:hypothetical protein n=1 Tax=Ekhidna sp. TaxID=2608089 RepID=UPI0032ED72C0